MKDFFDELEGGVSVVDIVPSSAVPVTSIPSHAPTPIQKKLMTAEDELYYLHKLDSVGKLSGGMAHEFSNILSAISGHTSLLKEEFADNDRISKRLNAIERSVDRAVELTRKFRMFSSREVEPMSELKLPSLIDEAAKLLRVTAPKSVMVAVDVASDLWPIEGARDEILQALLNLGMNAEDAMVNGGVVTIKAGNVEISEDPLHNPRNMIPGPKIHLTIMDTGAGIPDEIRAEMFKPFFTTRDPTKRMGMGLSMVQRMVDRHRGDIFVESQSEFGSRIEIYLPALKPEVVASEAPLVSALTPTDFQPLKMPDYPLKVWVVEDDFGIQELMKEFLEPFGFQLELTSSGLEALNKVFISEMPDAVILDVMLSKITGYHVFDRLREKWPNVPVVFVTGLAETELNMEYLFKPLVGFLQKPFAAEELRTAILKLTSQRKPEELTVKVTDVGPSSAS